MKFVKYRSITNHYKDDFVQMITNLGYTKPEVLWVATEKIHGCNYSLWYDGEEHKSAKRSAFVYDDANFSNHQVIYRQYRPNVEALYNLIKVKYPDTENIAVYGELYGGRYDHENVERVIEAQKIQKGVYYCPQNAFAAFDIKVDEKFLSFEEANHFLKQVHIPVVPMIMLGTFQECFERANDFTSTVFLRHDLPEIKDNIAEGLVIRPYKEDFYLMGSEAARVIIKSKNVKFTEKKKVKRVKTVVVLEPEAQRLLDELKTYITVNRVRNVASHDEYTKRDFSKLMGHTTKDVFEEFMEAHGKEYKLLEKEETKAIQNLIKPDLIEVVREVFLKEII